MQKALETKLNRHFLACSAFVGTAALLTTQNANAEFVYSGVQNITVPLTNGAGGIYLNLENHALYIATTNGNGGQPLPGYVEGWDINPYYSSGRPRIWTGTSQGSTMATNAFPAFGLNAISLLSPGDVVGPSLTYANNLAARQMVNTARTGPWVNTTGYAPIRFTLEDTSVVYGWMQLSVGNSGVPMTIIDWAYESSGGPITVPEPSTVALGCLSAGAVGLAAWRKRKKKA